MKLPKATLVSTTILLLVIGVAFAVLKIPLTQKYALQIFALVILVFFVTRKFKERKFWHVLPNSAFPEMPLLTFAFLILIGSTGNLNSHFFALTYILLFLLAVASEAISAIIATVAIMIFYFAMTPEADTNQLINLITLPVLLTFFLFAKKQYDESQANKLLLQEEAGEAAKSSAAISDLTSFINTFLKPKLWAIANNAQKKDSSLQETLGQISLLSSETDKILHQIEKNMESKIQEEDGEGSEEQFEQQSGETPKENSNQDVQKTQETNS